MDLMAVCCLKAEAKQTSKRHHVRNAQCYLARMI